MTGLQVREAREADAAHLIPLIELLGHGVDAPGVASRIADLLGAGIPQLVAVEGGHIVGLCGLHEMAAIHRRRPVGRITILAVAEGHRGRGIGRLLVAAAEAHFRKRGCELLEVTSNDRLTDAHAFYQRLGYERTSKRFAKRL